MSLNIVCVFNLLASMRWGCLRLNLVREFNWFALLNDHVPKTVLFGSLSSCLLFATWPLIFFNCVKTWAIYSPFTNMMSLLFLMREDIFQNFLDGAVLILLSFLIILIGNFIWLFDNKWWIISSRRRWAMGEVVVRWLDSFPIDRDEFPFQEKLREDSVLKNDLLLIS